MFLIGILIHLSFFAKWFRMRLKFNTAMHNLHRIFIAVNLPENLRRYLADFSQKWPQLPAKWAKPETLHITLNFLGNANDEELGEICRSVIEVSRRHDPFALGLNRVAYGPQDQSARYQKTGIFLQYPRMIWAMGEKSQEIGNLQKDLESSLFEFSGARYRENDPDYAFSPHVTLARLIQADLRRIDLEEIPTIEEKIAKTFTVESIEVMESELRRGGPVYTVLESAKLGEQ